MKSIANILLTAGLLFASIAPTAQAVEEKEVTEEAAPNQSTEEKKSSSLMEYSLEELMSMDVTTVSKGKESLFETPAAIYVITQEDIRRSGIDNVPDLMRMVPGMHVAKNDAGTWAVGARGFNAVMSNKLLVLIDGRSIYNANFNGVFWNFYDISLNDIERIEVIKGPGGTLWGANAVNGVINIITKHAKDTQKGLLSAGGGYPKLGFADLRYGGANKAGDVFWRLSGKYFYHNGNLTAPELPEANDQWQTGRTSFRLDWDISKNDALMVTSDFMVGKEAHTTLALDITTPPFNFIEQFSNPMLQGDVLGKWDHQFSEKSDMSLQMYYNMFSLDWSYLSITEHTFDLDFQHRYTLGSWNEFLWGGGYRLISDATDGGQKISYDPEDFTQNLFTWFVQDKMTFVRDRFFLTVGSKFEHNAFSGFEFQPSARLLWTPHTKHTLWWAFTRSVKTPHRQGEDIDFGITAFDPGTGPVLLAVEPGDLTAEKILTGEMGYRVQPTKTLYFDLAGFFSFYDDLAGLSSSGAPTFETTPVPHTRIPNQINNDLSAQTFGLELAGNIDLFDWWNMKIGFSWLELDVSVDPGKSDTFNTEGRLEENDPRFMAQFRSSIDLPHDLEWDTMFYFVDNIGDIQAVGNNPNQIGVGKTYRLDLQLSWKPSDKVRLSIVGQNLLKSQESEFADGFWTNLGTDVPRGGYGKVAWEF